MQRHDAALRPAFLEDAERRPARRLRRESAILLGLALLGAAITVVFGIWMAGVVPAASIGAGAVAP